MACPTSRDSADSDVASFKSIASLIVFLLANAFVVFPLDIPVPLSPTVVTLTQKSLVKLGIIPPQSERLNTSRDDKHKPYRLIVPINFVTAPLIGVIFLLAIQVIGRAEVCQGILGANHIEPLNILGFFITLAYLAISLDATGLIRFSAFWVLKKGGDVGHRLYFLLYTFFFLLGSFIGNDPIILSGTAFLAYLTRVAANIKHPRAWIYSQFAIANISSAILVSSNPTNLVLAGAFNIRFLTYTANMIVPVVVTVIILFPFLLYIIFPSTDLIPLKIEMHELPEEGPLDADVHGPSLPHPVTSTDRRPGLAVQQPAPKRRVELDAEAEERLALPLKDIINPFMDKSGAVFGGVLITVTLVTILATNAAGLEVKVAEITTPAAFVMLCRDAVYDWRHRNDQDRLDARMTSEYELSSDARNAEETNKQSITMDELEDRSGHQRCVSGRKIAARQVENHETQAEKNNMDDDTEKACPASRSATPEPLSLPPDVHHRHPSMSKSVASGQSSGRENDPYVSPTSEMVYVYPRSVPSLKALPIDPNTLPPGSSNSGHITPQPDQLLQASFSRIQPDPTVKEASIPPSKEATFASASPAMSRSRKVYFPKPYILWNRTTRYAQNMFPTVCAVLTHLPFALLPFAFSMFILVQGLVTKGWVALLAKGWAAWIARTGVVGAVGGMGFVSVCMCNFSGTNIGASILLSRVLQNWFENYPDTISDRIREAAIYALALGVNYGAFSATFNASLAGLLWRDILRRKYIRLHRLDFARINLPIIAIAMSVGCGILTAQVYIVKSSQLPGQSS